MYHTHTHAAGRTDWIGQVLSHQYKIASKLELFVGTCPDADKLSYQKCKWKRLGYLSLAMCIVCLSVGVMCVERVLGCLVFVKRVLVCLCVYRGRVGCVSVVD